MKKLIFIDNDDKDRAQRDSRSARSTLELWGGLSQEYVRSMEVISDFRNLNESDKGEILFDPNNVISTYSMYTWNHYGSLYQMTGFLEAAGQMGIEGIVYLDCSGNMERALKGELDNAILDRTKEEIEEREAIFKAIEANYIISFDTENDHKMYRLRMGKDIEEKMFRREEINLNELVK